MELDNFRNLPAGQSKINIPPPPPAASVGVLLVASKGLNPPHE